MKGTRHNGRSGKDGVYNPLHNDRRFDPEHSEHIDNERVRQNIYWDCYQGYTTMADRGKEDNFSFNQIEMAYYVDHYSDYVINQNKRHEKARHPDRCKGVEDVLKNKKTCPEESIYQLGTIDEHASVETLVLVFDEFKKEFDERFGSNVHIIDWSLHMDEATPHIHERHVFDATNRYGEIEPKQEAALEELGFELPNPEKKRSKTNNRKVVFDSACRTMFLDICKRHGLEIDEEPSYGGRQYLEKQDYIRMKQKEEIAVQQEMLNQQRDKVNANHLELARQSNHVRANEKVIQSQKEKIEQQEKEFKENFISNSDRILSQGELIEEQREELQQLILDDEKEARSYFDQLWAEVMEIYWSTENKSSLLKFSKEMEQEISEYRKQFTQEDTMAGMIQGWLDAYKGSHVCSVQIWKEAFDHFDREPKKFETNEICSIMDTQITGWKRAGVHRFSKEGYGRQRSWIREGAEEEGGNEPDKDGFTKLTKAEQLELPFDLPDREKG